MGTTNGSEQRPLWLEIEAGIQSLTDADFQEGSWEASVRRIAAELDEKGFNVSRTGGHLLDLRWAMEARREVGRPLLGELTQAIDALTLEDTANIHAATMGIVRKLGESWDAAKKIDFIRDVGHMVEATGLSLLIEKAKGMEVDGGIRYLRQKEIADEAIIDGMGITQDQLAEVDAAIAAEQAEIERVEGLLEGVADKGDQEKIKHLLNSDVAEELIVSIAGVSESAIADTKAAMEEEIREKERLAAEAAAKKKAEAEGPSLDAIEPDDMLQYIEEIREILEFSSDEKEIRVMCEQSSIPKALADIAATDPDKLDELEAQAEG